MIDVLSGASAKAQADAELAALFPDAAHRVFPLDKQTEDQNLYPRMIVRHVRTTWKLARDSTTGRMSKYDETTFEFIAHGDDLPRLMQIQNRLLELFGVTAGAFPLRTHDGSEPANAAMSACQEAPGGSIQTLPQPSLRHTTVHKLTARFTAEVTRHL